MRGLLLVGLLVVGAAPARAEGGLRAETVDGVAVIESVDGAGVAPVDAVRAYGRENPGAMEGLRQKLGGLSEGGPEVVGAALGDWLAEHAPRIAAVRAMGGPGADEAQIAESLEVRRALLEELAGPTRDGLDEGGSLGGAAGGLAARVARRALGMLSGGGGDAGDGELVIELEPTGTPGQPAGDDAAGPRSVEAEAEAEGVRGLAARVRALWQQLRGGDAR